MIHEPFKFPGHWRNELRVHQWSGRQRFNWSNTRKGVAPFHTPRCIY